MVRIRCVVERITYQNPENGYSVLKCRVKDYSDLVPVVGNLLDANVGSVLLVEGNWKVDSKYGRQFIAENWEETLPATVYGMEKYLGSGLIKGVGPKFAKRIVQKFGVDTFTVIEDNVELLIEVEGIGRKRVRMIAESWERQKEVKNIMLFLQEHQVSSYLFRTRTDTIRKSMNNRLQRWICSLPNHVLTVSAASASTCSK
jgi:exodeoxyribonuclease V alpha subunit